MADFLILPPPQLALANPAFMDDSDPPKPVDLTNLTLTFDSADSSIVAWEKRNTSGAADPAGMDAVVAQGPLGKTQVHCTAMNPDGTTVTLTADVEVRAKDAVSGNFNFGPVMEKA